MKAPIKILLGVILFAFLTALTQIGGLVFLMSLYLSKSRKKEFRFKSTVIFLVLYLIVTFLIVPYLAPLFGRQKIATSANLRPAAFMTIILNRNYVSPSLNNALNEISKDIPIRFLDANFPFINNFPMLPHLSHNDGNKIDLSFIYETEDGVPTNRVKSLSGYGVFEAPKGKEFDQISECKGRGSYQYDFSKYLGFGRKNSELKFSEKSTKNLIANIINNDLIEKVFIEPHLVTRLNLNSEKVRFHGCQAVRHDDHIHVQIKKEK